MGTERNKRDTKFIRLYRLSGDSALIYHPLSQKAKKPFLLLLSICFYAIGGVKFLPLLALTVAFNFFAAQKLERTEA